MKHPNIFCFKYALLCFVEFPCRAFWFLLAHHYLTGFYIWFSSSLFLMKNTIDNSFLVGVKHHIAIILHLFSSLFHIILYLVYLKNKCKFTYNPDQINVSIDPSNRMQSTYENFHIRLVIPVRPL